MEGLFADVIRRILGLLSDLFEQTLQKGKRIGVSLDFSLSLTK